MIEKKDLQTSKNNEDQQQISGDASNLETENTTKHLEDSEIYDNMIFPS